MKNRNTGILLSYVNTGLNMVCGLFLSAYLLRVLGDTEYGIYQTVASFANYLVLLEFGTGTVMTRNISLCRGRGAEEREIQKNVSTIWMLACLLTAIITIVAVVFYCNLDKVYANTLQAEQIVYGKRIFLFVTIHLVCSFLMQTLNGIILAYEHYSYSAVLGIARVATRTVLLVGFLTFKKSALTIAQVDAGIGAALLCVSACYVYKKCGIFPGIGKMDGEILKTVAPLSIALFLQTIVNQANNNVDKFLIGIMLSPESVALYSVAMFVYSVFSSLTTIPISMYAPAVIKQVQADVPRQDLWNTLLEPCRLTAFIGGMIYFGFLAMGGPFVQLVYGQTYTKAWIIALIIMTPMYLNMVTGVINNVLDALNKRMIRSVALFVTTAVNIVLTIIWLDVFGIIGAALATAICTFLGQVLFMNIYYRKRLNIDVLGLYRHAFKGILPWLALGSIVAMTAGVHIESALLSLLVRFVLFCITVFSGILTAGLRPSEKKMLHQMICRRKQSD